MIIGIDEVGDFAVNSNDFNYFIVAQIDQDNNGVEIKKKQFNDWLKTIPEKKKNENGEVKGKDLDDNELLDFSEQVIASEPLVRTKQIRIVPRENSVETVSLYKEIEISRLEFAIQYYIKNDQKEIANQLQKLIYWYKNRNYQQYLKILLLNYTIGVTIEETIGTSILLSMLPGRSNVNLLEIKLKIDRDFINGPQPRIFWGEILRNSIRNYSQKHPLPLLDEWKETGHPFLEKYLNKDGKISLKSILKDNCHFLHSHEHFEIQLADITGNIIHRYQNKGRSHEAYHILVEKFSKKSHKIFHLTLDTNPNREIRILD